MSKHRTTRPQQARAHRARTATARKPAAAGCYTTQTRTSAWGGLTELADELATLDAYLEPSREPGAQLSQMSAETSARVNQLMARERAERFGYGRKATGPRDPWGLDIIYPIGASQSPARVTSLDAAAHAHTELVALEHRITRALAFCPLGYVEQMHAASRAMRVRSWLPLIGTAELLADVDTTITKLLRYVTHAIDGDPSSKLDAPCPFCGRRTLVAYPARGIIRCDRHSNQTCQCPAGDGCTQCSHGFRHVWRRDDGGWQRLATLLKHRASERVEPAPTGAGDHE